MTGNVAFMFLCTVMVLFMTPGLAFHHHNDNKDTDSCGLS